MSIDSGGVATWTFSGIHGDIIYLGNSASTRYTYDPFGQVIDSTGNLGTLTADDAGPNTLTGNADNGWAGPNRKLYEHQGSIATIEMGARQYVPGLGRFLETDPITGGNTADYNYPNDPINGSDMGGKIAKPCDCGVGLEGIAFGAGSPRGLFASGESALGKTYAPIKNYRIGQAAEHRVESEIGAPKFTGTIKVNGRNRTPDFVTDSSIIEVKYVNYQTLTKQIRDYQQIASETGKSFIIYVRVDTKLSGPLQEFIDENGIIVETMW